LFGAQEKMTTTRILLAGLFTATMFTSVASAEELNRSQISAKFQSLTPFEVMAVEDSPLEGLYQIVTTQGVFYASRDGQHLISGALHKMEPGLPNLTSERQAQMGAELIRDLKGSFVTFPADNEKHEIIVFYDTTCSFCHRMHKELDALNDAGVTVHYAGWPREGLRDRRNPGSDSMPNPSQGYSELMAIWCDENPRELLDANANGGRLRPNACTNRIDEHYDLGHILGVQGTPAVYDTSGNQVIGGYASAERVVEALEALNGQ